MDVAGLASLGMSEINKSTVQELIDANECVSILKKDPYLGLIIPSIPLNDLRWAVIQDASWANATGNKSQAGFILGATSYELWKNKPAPFGIISYRSHGLKRVTSSTLAAETLSMSEGLAEAEWVRGLFGEMVNPEFTIVEWSSRSRHRGLMCASRSVDPDKRLKKILTICDAKSLYDHLNSETSGTASDKRTAIEIQIVRSSLDAQGGEVRWVDHSGMYADALTKKGGNIPLIQTLMRTGRICITEESAILAKHQVDPKSKGSHSKTYSDPADRDTALFIDAESRHQGLSPSSKETFTSACIADEKASSELICFLSKVPNEVLEYVLHKEVTGECDQSLLQNAVNTAKHLRPQLLSELSADTLKLIADRQRARTTRST